MAKGKQNRGRLSLSEFLPYRLSVLAETVSRAFAQRYEQRFGITIPEWRVMAVLGEQSPQSTQKVIERTRMDRVRVSRAVIRLDEKGLVGRTPMKRDQRAHSLHLTQRGSAMYREIVPLAHGLQAELMQSLQEQELRALEEAIRKLQEAADLLSLVNR
jgi:DNA-binding MarR family transcriptional regulator